MTVTRGSSSVVTCIYPWGYIDWSSYGERELMATAAATHALQDEQQTDAIIKRVKRAQGQMGAVVRMLEEGRSCEEIVTLMSAVAKAVNTAAFTLISASLKECIADPTADTEQVTMKLQKIFLSLA